MQHRVQARGCFKTRRIYTDRGHGVHQHTFRRGVKPLPNQFSGQFAAHQQTDGVGHFLNRGRCFGHGNAQHPALRVCQIIGVIPHVQVSGILDVFPFMFGQFRLPAIAGSVVTGRQLSFVKPAYAAGVVHRLLAACILFASPAINLIVGIIHHIVGILRSRLRLADHVGARGHRLRL